MISRKGKQFRTIVLLASSFRDAGVYKTCWVIRNPFDVWTLPASFFGAYSREYILHWDGPTWVLRIIEAAYWTPGRFLNNQLTLTASGTCGRVQLKAQKADAVLRNATLEWTTQCWRYSFKFFKAFVDNELKIQIGFSWLRKPGLSTYSFINNKSVSHSSVGCVFPRPCLFRRRQSTKKKVLRFS